MASDEQLNNQERSNDLQRESNELLKDYSSGILESVDFVNVLTSRTSKLVDYIRDANKEKGKTLKADRDLTSSVTKISDLTKNLATPYTDMGKVIRDNNKATDLLSKATKDLVLVETNLGEEQLKGVNNYMAAKQKEADLEQTVANKRKNLTSSELKSADAIIEKRRQSIEAERQLEKFQAENNLSLEEYNNMHASIADKIQKEADAKAQLKKAQDQYNADVSKQVAAEEELIAAERTLVEAKAKGDAKAIEDAEALIKTKQDAYGIAERATKNAKDQVNLGKSAVSQAQDSFTEKEKELQLRQKAYDAAEKDRKIAEKSASERAKSLVTSQHELDIQRDVVHDKEAALNADQKAYMAGKQSIKQLEASIGYLDEEEQRVRGIVHSQTLWNASLGAVEGLMKKIGLGSQVVTVGLDEGKKAAQSMAEELVATRREAIGAAADAKKEAEEAIAALSQIEQEYQDAIASGDAARIASAQKAKSEAQERAKTANEQFASAEAASKKANSLVSKIGGSFKVLGAGLKGTFKGMASELKALGAAGILIAGFKKAFKFLGGNVVTGFISDLKGKFTEGIDYIKNEFFSLDSYIADAKAGDTFLQQMSQHTAELATNLGVGTKAASELEHQAGKMSASLGMMPEELAKTTGELQKAFGTTQKFSDDTVRTMGQMTHLYGLSNEEAAQFVKLSQMQGKEASDTVLTYKTEIQALKERNNVAISEKEVMKEIASMSTATQLTLQGQGKSLASAAFQAKKLGLEMGKVEGIAGNLLNFEESIGKEMEAELLIGKDLQLDKARQAALQGDLATVAEEIANQVGSAEEFGKMNVMQQEALAAAVGMTRDELAKSLQTQELLADTGFKDMSEAQEEYRKLLKETGSEEKALAAMKAKGAGDALQGQLREISQAEKRAQQERDVLNAQAKMAAATNKLFDAFKGINKTIKDIKAVIVTAMKPFFDSFGKTVGEGGDAFKTMVLPYAKKLGEFMNDVGLRLVSIVRDNGPQIKAIFSGVLELFGSIYNVVGGVVKQLLGIKDSGASSKGFFESIKDAIAGMVEKLQNVDISALTEKIKGFIDGVKNIFKFISDKVGAIGKFFGKNPGITKMAGMGAFAFSLAPGAIKDLAGSVGGAIKDKAMGGLKKLGSNLGNKLTEKLGLGKLFGSKDSGKKPSGGASDPLYVQNVGEGGGGGLMDMVTKIGGRQAGIGGGFKKGWKGLFDYAKMAMKGGRAGKVGRARLLRAGKGLLTGQGASFVGGTGGKGAAQAAGKLAGSAGKIAGAAGKLGKVAGSLGKIAAGGGIGAVVGLAAEATLGHFQKKAEAAAGALDEQIAMTDDAGKAAELEQARQKKLNTAQNLEIAGTTAKYAGLGATIGSAVPIVGTALGAAAGAVVGFTVGMVKAEKERKYQASEEAKFQAKYRRLQLRNAKDRESIEQNALKLKLQAEKDAAKAQLAIQQEFKSKLEGVDLNVPLDGPNAAFEDLAKKMLDAGNITEEQFTQALNGTITPLQLMNAASSKAANNLKDLYNVVGEAAAEQAGIARDNALAAQGTNSAILESEKKLIEGFTNNALLLQSSSKELFDQFGDQLTDGIDTYAAAALTGTDSDVGSGIADALRAQLEEETGQSAEAVNAALAGVAAQLEKEGDFKLSSEQDLIKVQQLVAERLLQGVDAQALEAEKAANKAEKAGQEFGLANTKTINALTKSQLETNTDLQEAIKGMEGGNEQLQAILEDGQITTEEIDAIKAFMTSAATALAGQATTDSEAAKQLENFTNVLGSATQADDFIFRPGQAPVKFNEDDLLIGGTNLDNALGTESPINSLQTKEVKPDNNSTQTNAELKAEVKELKEIMGGFVQQMAQVVNRPVVVELDGNKVGESIGRNSFLVQ